MIIRKAHFIPGEENYLDKDKYKSRCNRYYRPWIHTLKLYTMQGIYKKESHSYFMNRTLR